MRFLQRYRISSAVAFALMILASAPSFASSHESGFTAEQRKAVEGIVRKFIMENPEVILQSIQAMQARADQAKSEGVKKTLAARRQEILHDPDSHVGGNPGGDVTLVEFFDYRCGYCKRVHPTVMELLRADGGIRFVYKEFPILGPESVYAARAAIASRSQGKYVAFHNALIAVQGSLSKARVLQVAKAVGLDVAMLEKEIEDGRATADKILARNFQIAEVLDINGTPAFIVGDRVIRGAADLSALKEAVAARRAANKDKGG